MEQRFNAKVMHVHPADVQRIILDELWFAFVGHDLHGDVLLIPMRDDDERWDSFDTR